MIGIYKITSPSGRCYIGQSIDIERRFRTYLNGRCKTQRFLRRSFKKHGVENHKFEVLLTIDTVDFKALDEHEIRIIKEHRDLGVKMLNLTQGGEGSKGIKISERVKDILRAKAIGRRHSPETRIKIGNISRGRKFSEEHRRRLSEANKGGPGWTGKKHSEESKRKISEALKGIVFSQEHRMRLSVSQRKPHPWQRGRTLSAETRMKISESRKRLLSDPNYKEKFLERLRKSRCWIRGRKHTEEAKAKMREAKLIYWATKRVTV